MNTCDETRRVGIHSGDLCYGWLDKGHPWHGCMMEPGHDAEGGRSKRRTHECKCGETWSSYDRDRA